MKHSLLYRAALLSALLLAPLTIMSQAPADYYKSADGTKGAELKTALCNIIHGHTDVGYGGLLELYKTTDKRADGYLWDMYSDNTSYVIGGPQQNASYSKEGDSYNREHSVPQSWFNEALPMKSDAFHVVPADGYVNNRRGNFPYGEVGTATYSSHNSFSRLGTCTTTGYDGTVFEPNDEYKGDFARIYFYMVTCYEKESTSWYSTSNGFFTDTAYPGLTKWQMNMYLRWAKNDPVSQKEIDRNNAVYAAQKNRNPFVDFPGLEQYIWGSNVNIAFSYDDYVTPSEYSEWNSDDNTQHADGTYVLVTEASKLTAGDNIIIACPTDNMALSTTQNNNNRGQVAVTIINNEIKELPSTAQVFTLEGTEGAWYLNTGSGYIYAGSSSKNYLLTEMTADDNAKATITIDGGDATILFQGEHTRNNLLHNGSAKLFSCYASGQHSVQIFKKNTSSDINTPSVNTSDANDSKVFYNISGQRVSHSYKGIVIHNGRKYIIR